MKTIIISIVMVLVCLNVAYSQQIDISGKVTDADNGDPLPGVNVMVKGTTTGTVTNMDGEYTIKASTGQLLVFSFIGYLTEEVVLESQTEINVALQPDVTALEEVVVVGYGTMKKCDVTGSVVTIRGSSSSAIYGCAGSTRYARESASVISGKCSGVVVSSSSTEYKSTVPSDPKIYAGMLTAGELHDFSKWNLWTDIAEGILQQYQDSWNIKPLNRFMVQIIFDNGVPVIDCPAALVTADNEIIWSALTDNTGKAELWLNLFNGSDFNIEECKIQAYWQGQTYIIDKPKEFQDGHNNITIYQNCEVPDLLDVVFVVDATGSMADEIQYLKEELKYVIQKVEEKHNDLVVNLGSVFYRDDGDAYVTKKSDISNDISKTNNFINDQSADGGGDYPEAVDRALNVAINELDWSENARARLLFLISDAPPHQNTQVLEELKNITTEAAAKGIKIIPVASSGIDKSTEYLLRSLALATNGTYLFLTDHSGVGGPHIKPSTDKYDVNLLNDLLLKVFYQYTYAPPCDYQNMGFYESGSVQLDVITTVVLDSNDLLSELKVEVDTSQNDIVDTLKKDENVNDEEDIMSTQLNNNGEDKKGIKIYPNPTKGLINVITKKDITKLYLADISGKLLERFEVSGNYTHQLNIQQYPAGIYLIRYEKEGAWYGDKIILTH